MRLLFFVSFGFVLVMIALAFLISPIYEIFNIKIITYLQYSGFITFALLLEVLCPYILQLRDHWKQLLLIFFFFCLLATGFEMIWAFLFWFSMYELDVLQGLPENTRTLDTVNYVVTPPVLKFYDELNLNVAAKKNYLFFMMSLYAVFFMSRIVSEKI